MFNWFNFVCLGVAVVAVLALFLLQRWVVLNAKPLTESYKNAVKVLENKISILERHIQRLTSPGTLSHLESLILVQPCVIGVVSLFEDQGQVWFHLVVRDKTTDSDIEILSDVVNQECPVGILVIFSSIHRVVNPIYYRNKEQ